VKLALLFLACLALTACQPQHAETTPEHKFWRWFQSNESRLFDFEDEREKIFDQVGAELHKIDPALTFEFGPKKNGRREFVISADGIRSAFPKVEALYAAAPSLPRWKFIKFRPRRTPMDVNYGGVTVKARLVVVALEPAGPKANLTIFIPGYSQASHQTYMAIAFLLLDQALGEYDVETRIGNIDVKPAAEAPEKAYLLEALPKAFDSAFPKGRPTLQ
jgi:hypothetical protein